MSEGLDIQAIKADIERAQESLDKLMNTVMMNKVDDGFICRAARETAWYLEQTAHRLRNPLRMRQ